MVMAVEGIWETFLREEEPWDRPLVCLVRPERNTCSCLFVTLMKFPYQQNEGKTALNFSLQTSQGEQKISLVQKGKCMQQ